MSHLRREIDALDAGIAAARAPKVADPGDGHAIEHDPWMTTPGDPDFLPPGARWCRVCGEPDHLHRPRIGRGRLRRNPGGRSRDPYKMAAVARAQDEASRRLWETARRLGLRGDTDSATAREIFKRAKRLLSGGAA